MSSMASLILRAAARVARSAALAASRCATAVACSGGTAASNPLMRASSVAASATTRSPASSGSVVAARHPRRSTLPPSFFNPGRITFEANDKDLESDEALWDLYERWCKFFNEERSWYEMARRFSTFKETVLLVEENKKSDLPYRLGINQFADGKIACAACEGKQEI